MKRLLLFLLLSARLFAACHAVGPTSAGAATGADWADRMTIPSTPVRGDTYYFMDGSYGSYTFASQAGSSVITFKKAQSYDFGRGSDGCSNDISSGFTASTMAAGQASFSQITNHTNFVALNGNGRSTNPGCGNAPGNGGTTATDCGFFVGPGSASNTWPLLLGPSGDSLHTNWSIAYTEVPGANTSVNEEDDFMCWGGGCNTFSLNHVYTHNSGCVFFKIEQTSGFTVSNSYIWQNTDTSSCHGQMFLTEGAISNVDFHDNIIRDITGTGVWVAVSGGSFSNFNGYNNVLTDTSGSGRFGTSNGILVAINNTSTSQILNSSFIGNTIAGMAGGFSIGWKSDAGGSSLTIENNLLYNSDPFSNNGGSFTLTESNNTCLGGTCGLSASTDIIVSSSPPNPFVNWTSGNFSLVSNNVDWENGLALPSPYNLDLIGNARPGSSGIWNRGAFQFLSANPPAPPTGLSAVAN